MTNDTQNDRLTRRKPRSPCHRPIHGHVQLLKFIRNLQEIVYRKHVTSNVKDKIMKSDYALTIELLSIQDKEVDKVISSTAELSEYFGKEKTPRDMKDTIIQLLDEHMGRESLDIAPQERKNLFEK